VALIRAVASMDSWTSWRGEAVGVAIVSARLRGALASDRGQRGPGRLDHRAAIKEGKGAFGYNAQTTPSRIWSKPVSSIPPRSSLGLQKPPRWRACSFTRRALIVEAPKEDQPAPWPGHGGGGMGGMGGHGRHDVVSLPAIEGSKKPIACWPKGQRAVGFAYYGDA